MNDEMKCIKYDYSFDQSKIEDKIIALVEVYAYSQNGIKTMKHEYPWRRFLVPYLNGFLFKFRMNIAIRKAQTMCDVMNESLLKEERVRSILAEYSK